MSHEDGLNQPPEIVICSAVWTTCGRLFRCIRHHDGIAMIVRAGLEPDDRPDRQGFITSLNRYVTREEGRKLQDAAGIPSVDRNGYRGDTLYSEDLY